jgi:hypothetical protein
MGVRGKGRIVRKPNDFVVSFFEDGRAGLRERGARAESLGYLTIRVSSSFLIRPDAPDPFTYLLIS